MLWHNCLKEVADICNLILTQIWSSEIINNKSFPANLKLADLTAVFKKIDSALKNLETSNRVTDGIKGA